jgi:hypothetical protein
VDDSHDDTDLIIEEAEEEEEKEDTATLSLEELRDLGELCVLPATTDVFGALKGLRPMLGTRLSTAHTKRVTVFVDGGPISALLDAPDVLEQIRQRAQGAVLDAFLRECVETLRQASTLDLIEYKQAEQACIAWRVTCYALVPN